MEQQQKQTGLRVFYSYAFADSKWREKLAVHLSLLQREGLIEQWSDQEIFAGSIRSQAIDQAIHSADIILLLISANFLASDACYQDEMQYALERHQRGEVYVVPLLVRPCDWQHSPFAHLQCLPRNTKPVTAWANQDEAFVAIIQELRKIITQQMSNPLMRSGRRLLDRSGFGVNGQALYAAIFEKSSGPAWIAHYRLTDEQRQQTFDQLTDQGYRLVSRNGYSINGQIFFTGIFEQRSGPPWTARSGLTSEQFQQTFDQLVGRGYRLIDVSGYNVNGQALYTAIFEQSSGLPREVRHGLTPEQFQQAFDQLTGQGYRLVHMSGYSINDQVLYAAIFEKSGGPSWVSHHGLTTEQDQQTFDQLTEQGYRQVGQSAYIANGQVLWAGIFERRSGPPWVAYSGLTSEQLQRKFDRLTGQGYRLLQLCGYGV
jgi:Bacterial tandem repeat domain 1/TIR domain